MRLVDHVLDHILDHILDHMIISLVTIMLYQHIEKLIIFAQF